MKYKLKIVYFEEKKVKRGSSTNSRFIMLQMIGLMIEKVKSVEICQ